MSNYLGQVSSEEARKALALAAVSLKARQVAAGPRWRAEARPQQMPPPEPWRTWYVRGGRGSGKTWTGAHVLAEWAQTHPADYGVVAPTFADMRDKCVEGPSGLLRAFGTSRSEVQRGASRIVESWSRNTAELRLRNGSVIHGDGASDGAPTIQGFNLAGVWADEVGLWGRWEQAWVESIRYAVRVAPAKIIATGTPKRGHPLVRLLMNDDGVVKTVMRTSDNAANLDPGALADLIRLYGGTTLGRQELEGEVLDDVPGALWSRSMIEVTRRQQTPDLRRIVVAIDPSATSTESADECGIVVAGVGAKDGHGYVLADLSVRAAPSDWANIAVMAYRHYAADRIVAETNNGGDMVEAVIRTVDPNIPYQGVTASRGKRTRAEPVSALYEQGRVHHVGYLELLEDQQCGWNPETDQKSPDRVDALVWAITQLMVADDGNPWGRLAGKVAVA